MKSKQCEYMSHTSLLVLSGLIFAAVTTAASAGTDTNDSCNTIVASCKAAGFKQGGKDGEGLWHDCMQPILQRRAGTSRIPLPAVDATMVDACLKARPNYGK
jgi:hypothetical protein